MAVKALKSWLRRVVPAPLLRPILTWRHNRKAMRFRGRQSEEIFTDIYRSKHWGSGESVSGPGSAMAATSNIRQHLPRIFKQYDIHSMLDAPCGDFNWMRAMELGDIEYIGGDIVQPLIEGLIAGHGGPKRRFMRLDITADPLPRVDLIFCRDCFLHLTFEQIRKALKNFRVSGARYVLLSTEEDFTNFDILAGGARDVNLRAWPFNLPQPLELIPELRSTSPDHMGLWTVQSLPE